KSNATSVAAVQKKGQNMDYDSKDLMVVELESDTDANGFVEETANSALASGVSFEAADQAIDTPRSPSAVTIGKLSAWDDAENPLVDYPNNPSACFLPARTTIALNQAALGREVALMFVDGDPRRPLIIGVLQPADAK